VSSLNTLEMSLQFSAGSVDDPCRNKCRRADAGEGERLGAHTDPSGEGERAPGLTCRRRVVNNGEDSRSISDSELEVTEADAAAELLRRLRRCCFRRGRGVASFKGPRDVSTTSPDPSLPAVILEAGVESGVVLRGMFGTERSLNDPASDVAALRVSGGET
jgi:hypothetical protein